MVARASVLLEAGSEAARRVDETGVLDHRELRPRPILVKYDAVHLLLHVLLGPRVLAAQPVRSCDARPGDLAVELQRIVLEARDLAVVAAALGHIPKGIGADGTGNEAHNDGASGAHRAGSWEGAAGEEAIGT